MRQLKVVEPAGRTALAGVVEDYLTARRAKGLSSKTIEIYGYTLREVLLPFCADQGITEPAQLTSRALDRLSSQLLEHGGRRGQLSRHSVKSYMSTVSHFINWGRAEGEVEDKTRVQVPRPDRKVLEVLTREEIQELEDGAGNERDRLIIRLLADTGMRVGELIQLRLSDIQPSNLEGGVLRVRGKGAKERLVPIPRLYRRLQRYIQRDRPKKTELDRLFVSSRRGPKGDYEALQVTAVQQMLRHLGRDIGLAKRVHPHLLRHSYATWALSKGMNPITLAKILGHSSLVMIQQTYEHLQTQDLAAAMSALLATESD
jgi:integrase/recombinase XerD